MTYGDAADNVAVSFLAQGEQRAEAVLAQLATFIAGARSSLDFAMYDMRLNAAHKAIVSAALAERAAAGVAIRIAYDADKPPAPDLAAGQDPAPGGTGAFVQSLGYPFRRIGGLKLMHNKYIVRDGTAVWTGSTNMTDDALTLMENNILQITSAPLAAYYARDFADLWQLGHIENTGAFDTAPVRAKYGDAVATIHVLFSPGRGPTIDEVVAGRVRRAVRRIRICSMLLNSGTLLNALTDVLAAGVVEVSGIYDRTQMAGVAAQWRAVPSNVWKIGAVDEIVTDARLVGKDSTPYTPDSPHDFMHNKILVVDDTVITGSYNFSRSAQLNAENIVLIECAALADAYSAYIDALMRKYT